MNANALSIIFSSDSDSHLNDLTYHRTVASLPFGGRYRLIDFALSNLVDAGVSKVGIVAKNNYNSLMDHIRMGRDWDLNRKNSGIIIFPPFVLNTLSEMYKGKIDALYSLRNFLMSAKEEYVFLMPANVVTNVDLSLVERLHFEKKADITLLTYRANELHPRKNIIETDKDGRVVASRFAVSSEGEAELTNMGVYYLKKQLLLGLVDGAYSKGFVDFEKDIIQKSLFELRVYSCEVKNYVAVIDRIPAYFRASMDLLNAEIREDLFYGNGSILTKVKDSVPTRYRDNAKVVNSLIADGCEIDGTVENSILFRGVKVARGAVIKDSIVMENGHIMEGASLTFTITDKNVVVRESCSVAGSANYPFVVAKDKIMSNNQ
ncbi:MAG: glucose-1-phosphate adenylyltransferase subunit GlgD [Clostridiaceae bacterium]|jgi:glucose-1-phosphate adenylyltransferase|nr:glucose-1-phosphate adenylyltransferase subunit GlgD [Clostridiaceae bacterium]